MSRWLALGEPVSITLRIPTVRSPARERRLRERVAEYVDRNPPWPDSWADDESLEEWRSMKRSVRIATLLAERRAVTSILDGTTWWGVTRTRVPRWRWIRRRRTERLICDINPMTRWW